jgi:hypothetical protein
MLSPQDKTLGEIKTLFNCDHETVIEIWEFNAKEKKLGQISVKTYNVLVANFVDVFDLIPNNLAVPVTEDFNPYK